MNIIVKGDVLSNIDKGTVTLVLHGCNCFHTMGAGVARYLSTRYPKVKEVDKETKYGDRDKLGSFSIAKVDDNLFIVNCYTQFRYGAGKHFQPAALKKCLTTLRKELDEIINNIEVRSVMIGCGLGGYSWAQVRPIYEECFPEIRMYVR
jgi:O-acetyl-ADP-ribose deacetylase (regulator of RNase III)